MNLRNHLVDVVAEFFYPYPLFCRDKDTRGFFAGYPAVFQLLKRSVDFLFRFQGEFIIFLPGVGVHLVKYHIERFARSIYISKCLLYNLHLFLEICS